jgi:hypothetical protein
VARAGENIAVTVLHRLYTNPSLPS